ncbi:CBS domain-containing protein [Ralstonia solanacearum]|uniref:CBS domain-containing protein n=1 Tax=Ralstonia solanacearum TaxID=305 RepID=UPI0005C59BC4|nr:CBS domain-containing protein [Ralstonia solanacearum]MBB6593095.1 CBS domain-containing protein [Ralstonia solanacearum]MBB6597322.1 CBS domain-containing protein [Ralstonia solanacearum]MDB0509621.1 CBS domain-containing protein [Ralstonia solanacearum]MDB0515553.1 CBS domain-containing protein [Ralstonia solanacearum]MDB0528783.1 CBS domain-containing protein [Ralstonia solanacearum]
MRVQDVCSPAAVHIPLSCTLQEAARQMRDKHVGALIVTEHAPTGPRAVGVVTDRDIVLDAVAAGADPSQTCVCDVMSRGIVSVARDASLSDALQEMLSTGVRRVGVVADQALVGVLSLDDVLGAMALEWDLIARLVRNERERETTGSTQPPLSVG